MRKEKTDESCGQEDTRGVGRPWRSRPDSGRECVINPAFTDTHFLKRQNAASPAQPMSSTGAFRRGRRDNDTMSQAHNRVTTERLGDILGVVDNGRLAEKTASLRVARFPEKLARKRHGARLLLLAGVCGSDGCCGSEEGRVREGGCR